MPVESDFHRFGISHWAAIAATVAVTWSVWRLERSRTIPPQTKRWVHCGIAAVLLVTVVADPLCTWLRWSAEPGYAWEQVKRNSLPIHLCDIVALLLAIALVTRRQRLAELSYLWGLSGTLQGLLTPGLEYDWPAADYFAFFLQHGGIPAVAVGLVYGGRDCAPQPGALRRGWLWINFYLAVVFGLNALLGTNYGYLNGKPPHPSMLDFLGPWPFYLLVLEAVAVTLFALLLLPFWRRWRTAKAPTPG